LYGSDDVGAIPRRRERHRNVIFASERFDLSRKDLFEAKIITAGSQRGSVGGERESGQAAAIFDEAYGQFRGEVLRVGRAAAIAEEENLAAFSEALRSRFNQPVER